jgi:hypothetical protein
MLCPKPLWEMIVRLLQVHRILIASGIVTCVLYAIREGLHATSFAHLTPWLHIGGSVLGAVVLGLYLHTIRHR